MKYFLKKEFYMNANKDIKDLYFVLFILTIIEIVMFSFLGLLIAIPVLVISIIIYSKFPKNCGIPEGLRLSVITSGLRVIMPFATVILVFILAVYYLVG